MVEMQPHSTLDKYLQPLLDTKFYLETGVHPQKK